MPTSQPPPACARQLAAPSTSEARAMLEPMLLAAAVVLALALASADTWGR
jgi:hypothetical protein